MQIAKEKREAAEKKKKEAQLAAKKVSAKKAGKSLEDFKKENPGMSESQLKELMSQEGEATMADTLLADDDEEQKSEAPSVSGSNISKLEK